MFTNNSFPELIYSKRNFTQKTRTCRFKNVANRSRFNRFDGRSMLKTFDKSGKNNDASWIYAKRINGSFHGSARKNIFQRFYPGQNPRPLFYSTHGDREKSTEILRISFSRVNGARACALVFTNLYQRLSPRCNISGNTCCSFNGTPYKRLMFPFHIQRDAFSFMNRSKIAPVAVSTPLDQPSYQTLPPRVHDKDKVF